jgi:hypothetical protein
VEWIYLARDRYGWRAVVITAMNLRVLAPRNKNVASVPTAQSLAQRHLAMKRFDQVPM